MNQSDWTAEWRSADLWSESDLQALCCGLRPDGGRAATEQLNHAAERIRRAVLAKQLPVASEPIDAQAGDRMYGHHRFFDPTVATRWAVRVFKAFPYSPSDFEAKDAPTSAEHGLATRERDSLLRILFGMAGVKPYNFDPAAGRSEAAAIIAGATAAAGCPVDADTVRKYLKQAAQKFGKSQPATK